MRCFQSSKNPYKKPYLSHIEIGEPGDIDFYSFAVSYELQTYICQKLTPNTRLRLCKCSQDESNYVKYMLIPEDRNNFALGYTGSTFADALQKAIQRLWETNNSIEYRYYPNYFNDVYIDELVTCVSTKGSRLVGAKKFGDIGIWMGFTVSGFAQIDRDRY